MMFVLLLEEQRAHSRGTEQGEHSGAEAQAHRDSGAQCLARFQENQRIVSGIKEQPWVYPYMVVLPAIPK